MKILYTKTYNIWNNTITKQSFIEHVATELDYSEISLFRFDDSCDSDYELDVRMENIVSPTDSNDVVIFQYPSMVSIRYDRFLLKHLHNRANLKLVIFAADLGNHVLPDAYPSLAEEIELFNSANLLILQSKQMYEYLIANGLRQDIAILYHEIWEFPYGLISAGAGIDRHPEYITGFSADYLLDGNKPGINVVNEFGDSYAQMCNSLSLGISICKGMPTICMNGSATADAISKYNLGWTVNTSEEAMSLINALSDEDISAAFDKCHQMADIVSQGIFTRKLLTNAVYRVLLA